MCKWAAPAASAVLVVASVVAGEPKAKATRPFKLGTFEHGGRTLLGLVLDDTAVIDITAANRELRRWDTSSCRGSSSPIPRSSASSSRCRER